MHRGKFPILWSTRNKYRLLITLVWIMVRPHRVLGLNRPANLHLLLAIWRTVWTVLLDAQHINGCVSSMAIILHGAPCLYTVFTVYTMDNAYSYLETLCHKDAKREMTQNPYSCSAADTSDPKPACLTFFHKWAIVMPRFACLLRTACTLWKKGDANLGSFTVGPAD